MCGLSQQPFLRWLFHGLLVGRLWGASVSQSASPSQGQAWAGAKAAASLGVWSGTSRPLALSAGLFSVPPPAKLLRGETPAGQSSSSRKSSIPDLDHPSRPTSVCFLDRAAILVMALVDPFWWRGGDRLWLWIMPCHDLFYNLFFMIIHLEVLSFLFPLPAQHYF